MKGLLFSALACGLIAVGTIGVSVRSSAIAQEAVKTEKSEGAKKSAKSGDRLPANYAKIGVSEDQRKKIYEIQNKYDDQISALQKQIADLKAKETAEVEAVLTPEQKKALQNANEESKKKAAEKKKSGEKGAEKIEKGEK